MRYFKTVLNLLRSFSVPELSHATVRFHSSQINPQILQKGAQSSAISFRSGDFHTRQFALTRVKKLDEHV